MPVKFSTALRDDVRKRLERIGHAEVVVGIPCFNSGETISHVLRTAGQGLAAHFGGQKALLMVSDGGSTDDTREEAFATEVEPWLESIVTIYRGYPGKGSAVRAILEATALLESKGCLLLDSDLRSITPEWVRNLFEPVERGQCDFVAPLYRRFKYDGTITNNIVYSLTRAVYGVRVRQPIGGDFAISRGLVERYLEEDVWQDEVAQFGIDIWLTTTAIMTGARIGQGRLAAKIHGVKDPGEALGPMFRQVIFTLFRMIDQHADRWRTIRGSREVDTFGEEPAVKPEAFTIDVKGLVQHFRSGLNRFGPVWETVLTKENFEQIRALGEAPEESFHIPTDLWVKALYDVLATFHRWNLQRRNLVEIVTPLYFGRIASFAVETRDLDDAQAEELVEQQAARFEELKPYLLEQWDRPA
jgi:hypothetical protein